MPSPLAHDDPHALGPYRLIARLGTGGMGTVYLARSAGGRTVALKTMHAHIASDSAARTRFRLEVDAARVIGGHHGAHVVDADPLAGTPWLATEYVLGPPLGEGVTSAGPLPEQSVRALGAALCGALGQLHRSDVVHRDLKPSNIMVTAYGPKVIDFGIAHALGDIRLTRTGAAVGTPAFMSPEHATNQEHAPASDVFALAGVLVFALTGRGPFGEGQPADLLYRVRYAEPDLTGVPTSLAPTLAHCLAKDPLQRLSTMALAGQLHDGKGDFADHLPEVWLAEIGRRATEVWQFTPQRLPAPVERQPSPSAAPQSPRPSRRRLLAAGTGLAVGTAAAVAGVWVWRGRSEEAAAEGYKGPAPGPVVSEPPRRKLDSLWQIQVAEPPNEELLAPQVPLTTRDLVVFVAGSGLGGVTAKTGKVKWVSDQMERTHQTVSDGERIYRLVEPEGSKGHKGDTWPLLIGAVDLSSGAADEPSAEFPEFNGVIGENQLLCAADDVLYLAAGRGNYAEGMKTGFLASQTWSLLAVDIGTGKKLWTKPLPSRPDSSVRLHFLAAAVVGNRLVYLQEMNDGTVHAAVRDTRTGRVRWDKPVDVTPDRARLPLATDSEHVYLGGDRLQALRLSDGARAWDSKSARPGRTYSPPAVKDGLVYAVENGTGLVAVDSRSGTPRWTERGGDGGEDASLGDRPVIGSDHAYSKSGSTLRVIDLSSRNTTKTYTTSGNRFVAHEPSRMIVAMGGHFVASFPLK
ncbi:protein kinase [Streptomyces sp. Je 1-332]|uniref:protein kinase domain-containing protein n=1 Tax=Streptomyces sp. Je 1-332 TaxID=3231270 RepID=UPI0034585D7A